MSNQVSKQITAMRQDIAKSQLEISHLKIEIARIGRDLTLSDQQMTMLLESGDQLELQAQSSNELLTRQVHTQIRDLQNFQETNRRTRITHLERQSTLEGKLVRLEANLAQNKALLRDLTTREALLTSLSSERGQDDVEEERAILRKGVLVAASTMLDVAEACPFPLAKSGAFLGLMEVIKTSKRSLTDTASALKEVSSVCPGQDGAMLEQMLELGIHIQKLTNNLCLDKMEQLNDLESSISLPGFFNEMAGK
ncbi:unnamed protein product [Amoebophrya sp. A120]|nr:unnamed protein product [Amoebophrya sp. A120]|eukprot:GSA120T00001532001.1